MPTLLQGTNTKGRTIKFQVQIPTKVLSKAVMQLSILVTLGQVCAVCSVCSPLRDGVLLCRSELFQETRFEPSRVAFHSDHELGFEWWVNGATQSRVQIPFTFVVPYPESGATYFGVRLIIGHEYFYETAENVMSFPESETQRHCGEQIAYCPSSLQPPWITSCLSVILPESGSAQFLSSRVHILSPERSFDSERSHWLDPSSPDCRHPNGE